MPCYLFYANFQFVLFWFFYSLVLWLRSLSKSYCCYYYRSIYICCSAIMCLLVGLIFIFFMWWLLKFPSWFLSVHFSVFSSTDWCLNVIIKRYIYANLFSWYILYWYRAPKWSYNVWICLFHLNLMHYQKYDILMRICSELMWSTQCD